jgi:thiosulfate/3-mercaptopyruvate sulfurtransferase
VAPLEPWEKVLVNSADFFESEHGQTSCQFCHGGDPAAAEKEIAHQGIIARPSEDNNTYCAPCHADITANFGDSLHVSQAGYWESLAKRSGTDDHPEIDEMFGNHCASCHTSCGDCHVSQPSNGSRVGNEYLGKNEDVQADVHFRQGRMSCVDCHSGDQMHMLDTSCEECHDGTQAPIVDPPNSRYDGPASPACGDCHPDALGGVDEITMHSQHGDQFQCQVCHSVSYTSCDSCHVSLSEETGNPVFQTDGAYSTFMIGKNPIENYHRPYDYVVLRHVPMDPNSFEFYGEDLLPEFNALPTWVYATPHNIQRNTPQNESCAACHANAAIFLTADKLSEEELEANLPVILDEVPDPFNQ